MSSIEHIICAAIWLDDGQPHVHQPRNIKTGVVIGGWRHHNCIALGTLIDIELSLEQRAGRHQGFLTSTGRFVDREEAFQIASRSGQLDGRHVHCPGTLHSEDLY